MIGLIRAWSLAVADTMSVLLVTSGLTTAVGAIGLMETASADGLAHLSEYTSVIISPSLRRSASSIIVLMRVWSSSEAVTTSIWLVGSALIVALGTTGVRAVMI